MAGRGALAMRLHIGHLALRATSVEASATFLTEILGLRRTLDDGDDGDALVQ